jgi:transcriptional regulator with XRE-family HTH domain
MPVPSGRQPEPSPLARAVSAYFRMVMARDHVTTQALAEAAGLSRTYLGKRLRDEVPLTLNDVEAISIALGVELPKLPEL